MSLQKAQKKLREARKLVAGAYHDAPELKPQLTVAAEKVTIAEQAAAAELQRRFHHK